MKSFTSNSRITPIPTGHEALHHSDEAHHEPPSHAPSFLNRSRAKTKAAKIEALRENISGNWFTSLFEDFETKQFRVGRMLVEMQTMDHQNIDTFNYVVNDLQGKLEATIDSLPPGKARNSKLTQRDGAGACIIHIAYLFQKFEIGRYLVKRFPELSVLRYSRVDEVVDGKNELMPYLGENILHMAIASRNHDEVKWLLDFHRQNNRQDLLLQMLSARCFGHFFRPDFTRIGVYFGELPIHFAVCSNDLEILDLVLEVDPHSLFFQDSHGNNALHFCVIHSLKRMFDYVLLHAENIIRKKLIMVEEVADAQKVKILLYEQLLHVFNNDALTPFTLAARDGNDVMFRHILSHRKKQLWTYGPVECSVVDLTNLDTIRIPDTVPAVASKIEFKSVFADMPNAVVPGTIFENSRYPPLPEDADMGDQFESNRAAGLEKDRFGAIECLCQNSHLDMLDIPEVREIIEKKWDRFGKPTFYAMSVFGLCRTILVTAIICTFDYSERDGVMDAIALSLYPLLIVCMAFNFFSDLRKVMKYGMKHFGYKGNVRGASKLENVCSALEVCFFAIACVSKSILYDANNGSDYDDSVVRIFIALTAFVSWLRIYYILMGFQLTGNFVVIVFNILGKDIPLFLGVYITILLGFGSCHAILSSAEGDRSVFGGFYHFFMSIWGIFRYTMDGQNFEIFDEAAINENTAWLYQILQVCYNLCIVLLMLNLLIAMMSETYSDLVNKSNLILARERYNMMCSFEMDMTQESITKSMKKFSICEINSIPAFEMQTINKEWIGRGSAATETFDSKLIDKHVDMPQEMLLQASEGETDALMEGLNHRPEMINCRDPFGGTLLHWASSGLSFDTVKMLVRKGIDVNVACYEKKRTALHDAVTSYCEADTAAEIAEGRNIITLLVEKGCKYNMRDSDHFTALEIAEKLSRPSGTKCDEIRDIINKAQGLHKRAREDFRHCCKERRVHKGKSSIAK